MFKKTLSIKHDLRLHIPICLIWGIINLASRWFWKVDSWLYDHIYCFILFISRYSLLRPHTQFLCSFNWISIRGFHYFPQKRKQVNIFSTAGQMTVNFVELSFFTPMVIFLTVLETMYFPKALIAVTYLRMAQSGILSIIQVLVSYELRKELISIFQN